MGSQGLWALWATRPLISSSRPQRGWSAGLELESVAVDSTQLNPLPRYIRTSCRDGCNLLPMLPVYSVTYVACSYPFDPPPDQGEGGVGVTRQLPVNTWTK